MEIINAGNRNPRIIKELVDKFAVYFRTGGIDSKTANFSEILSTVFQIKDGLDTLSRRYLEVLEDVGGRASLSLLRNILHVPAEILTNQVEPALLQKGRIEIKPKGRILI
jgi:Holliday junction resolvasome RuvABC ATP-dependent DNA helicase subunit